MPVSDWINVAFACMIIIGGYGAIIMIFWTISMGTLRDFKKEIKEEVKPIREMLKEHRNQLAKHENRFCVIEDRLKRTPSFSTAKND